MRGATERLGIPRVYGVALLAILALGDPEFVRLATPDGFLAVFFLALGTGAALHLPARYPLRFGFVLVTPTFHLVSSSDGQLRLQTDKLPCPQADIPSILQSSNLGPQESGKSAVKAV